MAQAGPVMLARRMLWYRAVGQPSRQQPIVVLLGPVGSGKTQALDSIAADLGWGVVHARFDFDQPQSREHGDALPPTTVEVLMRLVFDLSQQWRNRATPRFTRFAIGLLAVQADLDENNRAVAKKQIADLIEGLRSTSGETALRDAVNQVADVAEVAKLVDPSFVDLFKATFPLLLRNVRPRLRKAVRSVVDFPQAKGGDVLDALVTLNRLPAAQQTERLVAAFLADVRENHRRMAAPEPRSPCDCGRPKRERHVHNWVLLLDNIDYPGGVEFLADLRNARDEHRNQQHPDSPEAHDPLLVIATSGRWHDAFMEWLPPWQPVSAESRMRALPVLRKAHYDHWAQPPADCRPSPYYPLVLDPLRGEEVAEILGTGSESPTTRFVRQATAGLPRAVHHLAELLGDRSVEFGARDVLGVDAPGYPRLAELRLTEHLEDVGIEDFVTAAPFATAPWLIPKSAQSRIAQPHVGRILTELRTALWVRAVPDSRGITPDQAALHPWVAMNLVSALVHRDDGAPSYPEQFAALRDDPDTRRYPVRRAYCQMALGEFDEVVTFFEQEFNRVDHQEWLDQLMLVVHAPDNLPLGQSCRTVYDGLVALDIARRPDRTPIRNNVARLVAACWLMANPFSVRDREQNDVVFSALKALTSSTERPDVHALVQATELAGRGRLL